MKTPIFLQSAKGESGAICLSMLLAYYESFVKLNTVKNACNTSNNEIRKEDLESIANRFGLNARFEQISLDTLTIKSPLIILTKSGSYLLLVGKRSNKFLLNDPEKGKTTISSSELKKNYSGWAMTSSPGADFKKVSNKSSFVNELKKRITPYKKGIIYVLIAGLILIIPALVIPALNKLFFDDIILRNQDKWFHPMIMLMIGFLVLGSILVYFQQWVLLRVELKSSLVQSAKFVKHIMMVPFTYYKIHNSGETIKRVGLNDTIAILMTKGFTTMFLSIITALFYIFVMIKYNWVLSIVGGGIMLLNIIALQYFSARRTALNQSIFNKEQATFSVATDGIEQIETLKATGTENDFFSLWSSNLIAAINDNQKIGVTSRVLTVLPEFITQFNNITILLLGGLLIIEGELTIGVFIALQSFLSSFSEPVKNLVDFSSDIQLNRSNINNLMDSLNEPIDEYCDLQKRDKIDSVTPLNAKLSGKLEVKNISFSYNKFGMPLITDFSLSTSPGKRVALVGGSGSGKSTLLKVMSGLYPVTSGEILYDGKSITNINKDILRNSLSMVDQEAFFFTGTISDNIIMWNRAISSEEIVKASKDADIHNIISKRDGGYSSKVAPQGRNFSGGQRQRLEIARSLVTNPSILFLDEATSALDTETEKLIMDNFKKRNCTLITVAHRLSTIRDFDEIIVLDNGQVTQRGNHEQLLKEKNGLYYSLIQNS